MGEDVLMHAGDEVQLGRAEREARLLQLDGDGHLARASVHREMRDLQTTVTMNYLNPIGGGIYRTCRTRSVLQMETYSRYGFGSQDAEAPSRVLWRVQLSPAEVQFIGEGRGEDHPNHIQEVGLLRQGVAVLQTLGYLQKNGTRCSL